MKLLWTKNNTIVSKVIRGGFGDPCSHFAIELYKGQIVFQSNFFGCDFQASKTFREKHVVVFELEYPMSQEREDEIFDSVVKLMIGNGYDFKALTYFFWRAVLYKSLGTSMPITNAWASKNKDICVEVANVMPDDIVPISIKTQDLSMRRPFQLYRMIKELGNYYQFGSANG